MKVLIVFYSRWGHTAKLAEAIAEGVAQVPGAQAVLRWVAETASPQVIAQDPGWQKTHDELVKKYSEATMDDLVQADAIMFGCPTRYGNVCAELKLFIDRTGPLWVQGALAGKAAGVFCTNATMHSGTESTLLTMMVTLFHHGMILVGVPPTVPETQFAGSYYGACSVTGPAYPDAPTPQDLVVARAHGQRVAEVAGQLIKGRG